MKILIFLFISSTLFMSCTTTKFVSKDKLSNILVKDASDWTIEECNKVLNFYTADNTTFKAIKSSSFSQKVYIKVILLNEVSIKAMSRKEVIEKRLDKADYYIILSRYLEDFTSLSFNLDKNKIEDSDINFTKGYTFKVFFENISEPYQPIFLEDGYSYFFLENMKGEFSRVTEVTGLFVEDYFQLDGYLDAIITFSPFASNGNRLFNSKNLNESYKLVFNGLQNTPIEISWRLN